MKVAVFSDVQGNLPAMEVAVEQILAWGPDLVIMDGDLVNRGPSNAACLALFETLQTGTRLAAGQRQPRDLGAALCPGGPATALVAQMRRFADWTLAQLGERAQTLAAWPDHLTLHAPGDPAWVHVTHGTMAGNRDGVSLSIPDEALAEKIPPALALFVTAHTHKPLERRLGVMRILNVASEGSPFDGDPRGSWARLEHRQGRWETPILRFHYDRERSARSSMPRGCSKTVGPWRASSARSDAAHAG